MSALHFAIPAPQQEAAVLDYLREHRAAGEETLCAAALLERQRGYADWLAYLRRSGRGAGGQAALWLVFGRVEGRLLGMLDLRDARSGQPPDVGGHISYALRPSARGRGYAKEMLQAALLQYAAWGISRVILSCEAQNLPSVRTILSGGGVLEREAQDPRNGRLLQVYSIACGANLQEHLDAKKQTPF